jgi:hypothetical protein
VLNLTPYNQVKVTLKQGVSSNTARKIV